MATEGDSCQNQLGRDSSSSGALAKVVACRTGRRRTSGRGGETQKLTYDNGSDSQLLICGIVDGVWELRPGIGLEAKYTRVKRRDMLPNIESLFFC